MCKEFFLKLLADILLDNDVLIITLIALLVHNYMRYRVTYLIPLPWQLEVIQGLSQKILAVDLYESRS